MDLSTRKTFKTINLSLFSIWVIMALDFCSHSDLSFFGSVLFSSLSFQLSFSAAFLFLFRKEKLLKTLFNTLNTSGSILNLESFAVLGLSVGLYFSSVYSLQNFQNLKFFLLFFCFRNILKEVNKNKSLIKISSNLFISLILLFIKTGRISLKDVLSYLCVFITAFSFQKLKSFYFKLTKSSKPNTQKLFYIIVGNIVFLFLILFFNTVQTIHFFPFSLDFYTLIKQFIFMSMISMISSYFWIKSNSFVNKFSLRIEFSEFDYGGGRDFFEKDLNESVKLSICVLISFLSFVLLGIGDWDSYGNKIILILFLFVILLILVKTKSEEEDMLPFLVPEHINNKSLSTRFKRHFKGFKRHCLKNKKSQKIFIFLMLNFGFMFVEFFYGIATNSLGLVSDACHMLFDCLAMSIGLYSSYTSELKQDFRHTFGHGRDKVFSGFINAVFLLFVAASIVVEAFSRVFSPPQIGTHLLVSTSIAGLIVNLIGVFFFADLHNHHSNETKKCHEAHSHVDMNMKGLFLHVLADTLGSVGVIISSFLIKYFGLVLADPVCSLSISVLIVAATWPLLRDSGKILLNDVSEKRRIEILSGLDSICEVKGVKGWRDLNFFEVFSGELYGSFVLDVHNDCDRKHLSNLVHLKLGKHFRPNNLVVQMDFD